MTTSSIGELIGSHLEHWQTGWSMGAFGALAEFHQDECEPVVSVQSDHLARATARGAIRFDPDVLAALKPIAYETLSPKPHRWSHAVALCLPAEEATCAGRSVLTELGPDTAGIAVGNQGDVLFDMGLSLRQCDFCIRTSNRELLDVLRTHEGRSLFDPGNPAMAAILKTHPHRVAITKAGRTEVFQKIGGPDTGGVSPAGPHTHVLPKLMRSGRTHTANTPIPPNLVPVAFLHPANPVMGPLGEDKPFDIGQHEHFQALLAAYGDPSIWKVKEGVLEALRQLKDPAGFTTELSNRFQRAGLRIALRQQFRMAESAKDKQRLALIEGWRKVFDSTRVPDETDDEAPGHDAD